MAQETALAEEVSTTGKMISLLPEKDNRPAQLTVPTYLDVISVPSLGFGGMAFPIMA